MAVDSPPPLRQAPPGSSQPSMAANHPVPSNPPTTNSLKPPTNSASAPGPLGILLARVHGGGSTPSEAPSSAAMAASGNPTGESRFSAYESSEYSDGPTRMDIDLEPLASDPSTTTTRAQSGMMSRSASLGQPTHSDLSRTGSGSYYQQQMALGRTANPVGSVPPAGAALASQLSAKLDPNASSRQVSRHDGSRVR